MANESDNVLHLLCLEESQALVHVGQDSSPLERLFELPMTVTGPEQDGDVACLGKPSDSAHLVSNGDTPDETRNLLGHFVRGGRNALSNHESKRTLTVFRISTDRSCDPRSHGEAVALRVSEGIDAVRRLFDRAEQI